ncbi:MAG: hypothetical protein PVH22_11495 [Desulfobacteraceae bacterium]|jgi:hypothetical protein
MVLTEILSKEESGRFEKELLGRFKINIAIPIFVDGEFMGTALLID